MKRWTLLPGLSAFMILATSCVSETGIDYLVFRDVRVFDGRDVHERTTVVIAGDRIVEVAPDAAVPASAVVVEGNGRTLLPGLIDAHTHVGLTSAALDQALVFGVTTEFDMFSDPEAAARPRTEQASNGAPGRADVYSAGVLATAPRGHGTPMGQSIPTIAQPEAAHRGDRLAVVHVLNLRSAREALRRARRTGWTGRIGITAVQGVVQ